jgi:hypothetical protein
MLIGAVLVGLVAGFTLGGDPGSAPQTSPGVEDSHPCAIFLDALRPKILAANQQGLQIPTCARQETVALHCLGPLGIRESRLPSSEGLSLELQPTNTGFGISCWGDLDQDGDFALFRATEEVATLRVTASHVQ